MSDQIHVRTRSLTAQLMKTLSVKAMRNGPQPPVPEPATCAGQPTRQLCHLVWTNYLTALMTPALACVERTEPGPWRTAENLAATVVLAHRLVASSTSVPTRASSTARETSGTTVVPTSVNVLTPAQAGTNVTTNVPATTTSQTSAHWYRYLENVVSSPTVTFNTTTPPKMCLRRVTSTVRTTRRARCGLWAASLSVSVWTQHTISTLVKANVPTTTCCLATVNL